MGNEVLSLTDIRNISNLQAGEVNFNERIGEDEQERIISVMEKGGLKWQVLEETENELLSFSILTVSYFDDVNTNRMINDHYNVYSIISDNEHFTTYFVEDLI